MARQRVIDAQPAAADDHSPGRPAGDIPRADIRRFLIDHFDDEELTALCYDHFNEVYRNLPPGMTLNRKSLALLDYCERRGLSGELLAALRRVRPAAYERAFGALAASAGPRVDLNTATMEELTALPGIGPTLAAAIVRNRPYRAVDDLLRVPQFGRRRLAQLRAACRAGSEPPGPTSNGGA